MTQTTPLASGDIVQYRKVGTFRLLRQDGTRLDSGGGGWWYVEAVRAPRKYRELAPTDARIYVSPGDRI